LLSVSFVVNRDGQTIQRKGGFTPLEVTTMAQKSRRLLKTVAEIGAVAAASTILTLLVPMVLGKTEEPERLRARLECERIGAALKQYVSDTGGVPAERDVTDPKPLHWLRGAGRLSPVNPFDDGPNGELTIYLATAPSDEEAVWKGPYLLSVEADPWGNAYVVNAHAIGNGIKETAWVLSPGPNGILETPAAGDALMGDDVGVAMN
jgi:general secretion pathway protein G